MSDAATPYPETPRRPRDMPASGQDTLPARYSAVVRVVCMVVFVYLVFGYVNARLLHWFTGADGQAPLWLGQWTEYAAIVAFGTWRTIAERDPYTRKRLAFLTAAVAILWWMFPQILRIPEPFVGALPGQPLFPQLHTPGTLTFFAVLLLVLLFGRRIICGWNCPCVGICETVGFAFREKTVRGPTAWRWRHTKWFFFALYVVAFLLIVVPAGAPYVTAFYGGFLALVAVTYFGSFLIMPLTGNRFRPGLVMNGSHFLKRRGPPMVTLPAHEPPLRPAPERAQDWLEEHPAFDLEGAREQASRCLDCGVPGCVGACPLHNRIPEWMEALALGNVEQAAEISNATSTLPEVCGRLCPRDRRGGEWREGGEAGGERCCGHRACDNRVMGHRGHRWSYPSATSILEGGSPDRCFSHMRR